MRFPQTSKELSVCRRGEERFRCDLAKSKIYLLHLVALGDYSFLTSLNDQVVDVI